MGKEGEQQFRGNFIQRGITRVLEKADVNYKAVKTENLHKLRALLDQGESAGVILNHPSYADYETGAAIVVKEGLRDLTARSQLLMSDKYANSILLRVPVRTLGKLIGLDIVALRSHRFGGDKGNQKMNSEATKRIQENSTSKISISAPEGAHSPDGMQPARWGSSRWWEERRYLFPIAIQGTEKQWPGGKLNFFYYFFKGRKEHQATVIFGKPVPVVYMERAAEVYAQGDETELKKLRVDLPMLLIANLHNEYERQNNPEDDPNKVSKYIGEYYQKRLEELTEHPVSVSIRELWRLADSTSKEQQVEQQESITQEKRVAPKLSLHLDSGLI